MLPYELRLLLRLWGEVSLRVILSGAPRAPYVVRRYALDYCPNVWVAGSFVAFTDGAPETQTWRYNYHSVVIGRGHGPDDFGPSAAYKLPHFPGESAPVNGVLDCLRSVTYRAGVLGVHSLPDRKCMVK